MKWAAYGVLAPSAHRGEADERKGNIQRMAAYFRYALDWVDFASEGLSLGAIVYAPPLRVGRAIRTVRLFTTQKRPNRSLVDLVTLLQHTLRAAPLIFFVAFAVAAMPIFADGLIPLHRHVLDRLDHARSGLECHSCELHQLDYHCAETPERAAFHYDALGPALLSVFAMTTINHWGGFADDTMAIRSTLMSYSHSGYHVL
ncbi:hypothetical protein LSCM1_05628 [Leishmania martiniquensis]|uniref:Ion transport domain-containing protein n=1 Tax=Leishmania martiniquensis TaxID=1580590 RepID=A0A836GWU9_9TRYP|nr:hypothetical protein LSCM1_05628 [Leishmania martiniquensis]